VEESLRIFLSEFGFQVEQVERTFARLEERLRRVEASGGQEVVESLAYWLHNLYCAFEDLFTMVAGFFENRVESSKRYHIELLRRMLVRIEGLRPPLLSEGSFKVLDELRGFRHVFRHAYSYGLDGEKVKNLATRVLEAKGNIMKDIKAFRDALADMSE